MLKCSYLFVFYFTFATIGLTSTENALSKGLSQKDSYHSESISSNQ